MNRRHSYSVRPSIVAQRHAQKREELDEAAILAVMQTTPACTRERDMAVLALSYEQIKLYLELHAIPMEPEEYIQQVRDHWTYIDSNPRIYRSDGTMKWQPPNKVEWSRE